MKVTKGPAFEIATENHFIAPLLVPPTYLNNTIRMKSSIWSQSTVRRVAFVILTGKKFRNFLARLHRLIMNDDNCLIGHYEYTEIKFYV